MPSTKAAQKALRSSQKRRVFNMRRKNTMKDVLRSVRKGIEAKKTDEVKALVPKAYKAIDKAAKQGIIKKNTAARKKARVSRMVKNAATSS